MKKVLLVNWDNYPNNASGGVYAWEKDLIDNILNYEFVIVNLLSNPNANGNYTVPSHVTRVIDVPLFGCYRYEEFYKEKNQALFSKILRTNVSAVKQEFLPLYREFLNIVFSDNCDYEQFSQVIFKLHKLLLKYDGKKFIEHSYAWEAFIEQITKDHLYRNVTLREARFVFQIIQRIIQILSIEVPKVDIIHCSLAWFPAMIAVFASMESNCPVIITEHGVAFRDLSLYHSSYFYNGPSSILWKFFSGNIIRLIYSIADVIAPVCYANAKWEENLGADPSKINIIYNGIDTNRYRPMQIMTEDDDNNTTAHRPRVVYIGRVEVLKDVMNLIQSIKYVKEQLPDIQCLIYGISTDLDYSFQCINLVKSLELNENIKFMGSTKEPEKAYNAGDIIVLCSIAEGFPYTIIEAMACKKAVVSTDVGGVREALEECGVLVRSRHPHDLANAIVKLLMDKRLRDELAASSAKRITQMFTLEKSVNQYRKLYSDLIKSNEPDIPILRIYHDSKTSEEILKKSGGV